MFLKSTAAKERLKPFLSEGNREKTMTAPVCCIVAHDMKFYENLPRTFPHRPQAKDGFIGKDAHIQATAFRNGTLQGGYLMLAARLIGLDTGAMSGFDNAGVDAEFFAGTDVALELPGQHRLRRSDRRHAAAAAAVIRRIREGGIGGNGEGIAACIDWPLSTLPFVLLRSSVP